MIMRCVVLAFVVTVLYVVAPYLTEFVEAISPLHAVTQHLAAFSHFLKSPGGPVITLIGALMPAVAAALSAVGSHGEYAQIATRFQGTNSALRAAEKDLTQLLPNRREGAVQQNLRSSTLVGILMTATDTLVQEVLGWPAILQKKDIEPT
jgi:hypothetical protein